MKLVTREELAEILNCSPSAIKHWERFWGMPVAVKGRGRGKKTLYDVKRAVEWCYRNGKPDPAARLSGLFRTRS